MSDPGCEILRHVLQIPAREEADEWLEATLNREMIKLTLCSNEWKSSPCLLADIGDVLQRTTSMLSKLATGLAEGGHIETYIRSRTQEANAETDYSDIRYIQYLDQKHDSLRDIASLLNNVSADIATICDKSPAPPFPDRVRQESSSQRSSQRSSPYDRTSIATEDFYRHASDHSIGHQPVKTGDPLFQTRTARPSINGDCDDIQLTMQITMIRLIKDMSHRGKGVYTCPLGDDCTKAGKGVTFLRNSDFKEHLEKHVKMYKCDLPGCTNTSGFARRDQLERHRSNVPHGV